ncbi:MAG TPA: hydrogenase maturation protease [Symbiobacteriaceae bacterium]|nr:hydrogenase maturation protease [Symbiobacteriaceae bacterium]
MKSTLVLGLGNRLMMDDGIGVAVVELLAGQEPVEGVRYEVGETDFDHSLDLAAGCDRLIVVDAAVTGRQPGEVFVLPLRELVHVRSGLSVHELHFVDLLMRLKSVERGALIGIEPFRIDFHFGLSPELQAGLGTVVSSVRAEIERLQKEAPPVRQL